MCTVNTDYQPAIQTPNPARPLRTILWVLGICGVVIVAYANSFRGVFLFDDFQNIVESRSIRKLWPILPVLTSHWRPLLNLSFAVNYAISGLDVWSYHAWNLLVHLSCATTLFGIVRRTLLTGSFGRSQAERSSALAATIALLWAVHPLQTQSVTYIMQRAESSMGLFYLLALYCLIRGAAGSRLWYLAVVMCCGIGAGFKEVIATAPLLLFVYDCIFLSGSVKKAILARWWLYVPLLATEFTFFLTGGTHATLIPGITGSLEAQHAPTVSGSTSPHLRYLLTQSGVILHYLRLSIWPAPLCLDYGWPQARLMSEYLPQICVIGGLGLLTIVLLFRASHWGFWGVWFFLILALTSSFVPLPDKAFEHRMYLPLAAVVAVIVLLIDKCLSYIVTRGRMSRQARSAFGLALVAIVASSLTAMTIRRNRDYHSELDMWHDNVAKRPDAIRPRVNLAYALLTQSRIEESISHAHEVLRRNPHNALALSNLGTALGKTGDMEGAIKHYRAAIAADPNLYLAYNNLGIALSSQGHWAEAIQNFQLALRLVPFMADIRSDLALALLETGKTKEAAQEAQRAVREDPHLSKAHVALGRCYFNQPDFPAAIHEFQVALHNDPGLYDARKGLARAHEQAGDVVQAISEYQQLIDLSPGDSGPPMELGLIYYQQDRLEDAVRAFKVAIKRKPDDALLHNLLGSTLLVLDLTEQATSEFEVSIRLHPSMTEAHYNLGLAFKAQGKTDLAIEQFRRVVGLDPNHKQAREKLAELESIAAIR